MKNKKNIKMPKPDFEYPSFLDLKAYYEFTGIKPTEEDANTIVKNSLKWHGYRKPRDEKKSELEQILTDIKHFPRIDFTKMSETIQEYFNISIEYGSTEDIEELQKITKVNPILTEESIDKGYMRALGIRSKNEFSGCDYGDAHKIKEFCKKGPTNNAAEQIFVHALMEDHGVFQYTSSNEFYNIMTYINYAPTKEVMQTIYDYKIRNAVKKIPPLGDTVEKDISREIGTISSLSKIKPVFSQEAVQEAYDAILKNIKNETDLGNGRYLSTRLEEIHEITKEKPNWNEEIIQHVYDKGLEKEIELVKTLYNITNIIPKFRKARIQSKYRHYLKYVSVCEEEIEFLRDTLGFEIPEKIVQDTYSNFLKNGNYQDIKYLQKFTGIKPQFGGD
ncbi:MAG: hypothetical protein ACP5NV_03565 [Candidatus Woesearchaeota archaeon]